MRSTRKRRWRFSINERLDCKELLLYENRGIKKGFYYKGSGKVVTCSHAFHFDI